MLPIVSVVREIHNPSELIGMSEVNRNVRFCSKLIVRIFTIDWNAPKGVARSRIPVNRGDLAVTSGGLF